jgi:hypothetical protein
MSKIAGPISAVGALIRLGALGHAYPFPQTRAEADRIGLGVVGAARVFARDAKAWRASVDDGEPEWSKRARVPPAGGELRSALEQVRRELRTALTRLDFETAYPSEDYRLTAAALAYWGASILNIAVPEVSFFMPRGDARAAVVGMAFRPGNEIWLRADLAELELAFAALHEVRHLAQPEGMSRAEAEAQASAFASHWLAEWAKSHAAVN